MGIENGNYPQQPWKLTEQDIERYKKSIDSCTDHGLYEDVLNVLPMPNDSNRKIKLYDVYFREKYPDILDYVMSKSDPEKIKIFNELAKEFNEKTETMNEDERMIYIKKFRNIVYGRDFGF
ncbi:MAG: hypothetical protein ACD_7C00497G0011 [uncultured bacterium]|nr:MAG: hypothetical protein ACD_7C00497G0011 [uncultured bacterium]HBR79393.1 hypothetical protein [Candidatus Moranbacteria bacterium]